MPRIEKFKNKTSNFIETGSYLGDGIQLAIDSGFDNIYSIELSDEYYNHCSIRFSGNDKVKLIKGDSYYELDNLINESNEIFTYWLDGHYSGGNTGFGILEFPIMNELESILKSGVSGEIIYIDDMRILRDYSDSINENKIIELINKYKIDYIISYEKSIHDEKDIIVIEY